MKEFLSLRLLDRFRSVLERLGCDYLLLRKIVQIKLTLDARRVPTILLNNSRKNPSQDEDKNIFIRSLWVYGVMGLAMLPFVLMNNNYLFQMSIVFAILMFLVMTSMVSDFSSVLLDIRDRTILATKPVNGRTISFARTIHIIIYLSMLTGTLAGPALIAGLIAHGIGFFAIFLLLLILLDVFVLVITALLYLLILNVFDGERLKDLINYVQIALSITILVGYQLVARSFDIFKVHIVFHSAWWQVLVPPFWFGSVFTWLEGRPANPQIIILSVLALVAPSVLFGLYVRLMPAFERRLEKLAGDASRKVRKKSLLTLLSRMVCRSDEERVFFEFSSWMMAREREFKLKVYPSLGFSIVLPFIFMLNSAFSQQLNTLSSTKLYLSIYMTALMVPTVVSMLKYSGNYKAAWVYQVVPIFNLSSVYRGTIKAFLVRLLLPVYMVESIIFTGIFGWKVIPQLVAAGLSFLLYTVICFWMMDKDLPFSRPFGIIQQSKRYMVLILLPILAVFALIQFMFSFIPYGIYIYLLILLVLNTLTWSLGFRRLGLQANLVQHEVL